MILFVILTKFEPFYLNLTKRVTVLAQSLFIHNEQTLLAVAQVIQNEQTLLAVAQPIQNE